jgi:hypothetical protein
MGLSEFVNTNPLSLSIHNPPPGGRGVLPGLHNPLHNPLPGDAGVIAAAGGRGVLPGLHNPLQAPATALV